MRECLIIQRRLTHYRVPFFEELRSICEAAGIRLRVAYGDGTEAERRKSDGGILPWGEHLATRYALAGRLCWQPYSHLLSGVDMVVVTQENKLVNNLFVQYLNRNFRLGLWGHGANLQGDAQSFREKFKQVISRQADWWFAYTQMSVPLIKQTGFPVERITVLNNSVDTGQLAELVDSITDADRTNLRAALGIDGGSVGVYVGSLYEDKRVDFMLDAAERIRRDLPSFEFLVVGAGPQANLVKQRSNHHPWIRYLGPKVGREKVALISLAKVMINPGLVGLGILDAFVTGVPMATTDCGLHSPEIAYLMNGLNGVMTDNVMSSYCNAVVTIMTDDALRMSLVEGCRQSAQQYSIPNMAKNFADGVVQCLSLPLYR